MRFKHHALRFCLIGFMAACGGAPDAQNEENVQAVTVNSHAQVAGWFQAASPEALALPGAVYAYHDEAANRLVFGVENAAAVNGVRTAVTRLGIPASAFTIRETDPIYQVATLRDRVRPVIAALQINFGNFLCSIGFNADDAGARSFVTASHCTNTQGGVEGTQYFQPTATVDGTVIATEVEDPLYFKGGQCPRGRKCRFSDSSRALYSAAATSTRGSIASTSAANNGSLTITGAFTVTTQDNTTTTFANGTVVNKVGRTTGWTQGPVTASCANVNVSGSQITQLCQTLVTNNNAVIVQGGDSGSGVFRITSGTSVQLVGILWGGNSSGTQFVFSPLASVERELGSLVATQ